MPLTPGTQLGSYEIVSLLGAGGMGEVYRAKDTRLGRDVALKTLPDSVTQDPERLARFRREAQVLAALNHQHIASIYGLEEADRHRFLVLELVDGETLAARIQRGALPLEEAISIAREIAEALESAHEKGIVHRDLKPANIALTSGDRVKVLDFGLAKAANPSSAIDSISALNSPTITSPAMLTQVGVILGTAAYMSPEQARGKAADKRSDIWALGCVLFEMLAGKRAFEGSEVSDTLASILKSDPDWNALPGGTPSGIRRVLRRCLEKDPRRRFHDIADARLDLEEPPALEIARPPERRLHVWAASAVAVISLGLLSALAAYVWLKPAPAAEVSRFQVYPPLGSVFGGLGTTTGLTNVAVSPDGTRLVFVATDQASKSQLWIRALDSFDALPLIGTDGAGRPFWSPDSRWVGYFVGNKVMKIQAAGGSPQWITDVDRFRWGATWSSSGDILFSSSNPPRLYRVSDQGGTAVPLAAQPSQGAPADPRLPYFLPDGRTFLYWAQNPSESGGVYVTSMAAGSASKRLVSSDAGAAYDPSGFLLFTRGGALLRQRFDLARLEVTGETMKIAEGVGGRLAPFSVSTNGILAFQPRINLMSQFAWYDRTGRLLETVGTAGSYRNPQLSPDGKRLVYTDLADGNLWMLDMRRRIPSPFTTGPGIKVSPVWSRDGETIFYGKPMANGADAIFEKSATGTQDEKVFFKGPTTDGPTQISRDGKWLLYFANPEGETLGDVYALPITGDRTPQRIVRSPVSDVEPQLSPDGKFVAYVSALTGDSEIYVQPFPTGERRRISDAGGRQPLWRPDGRELFFVSPDRKLYAVEIKPGPKFEYGTPQVLFEMRSEVYLVRNSYIPNADGTRFLVNMTLDTISPPIHVVRNWTARLKN